MEAVLILDSAVKNPSGYGAWNVQRVATGTGEALPGLPGCVCW